MKGNAALLLELSAQRQPRPLDHGVVTQEQAKRLVDPDHVTTARAARPIHTATLHRIPAADFRSLPYTSFLEALA